MLNNLEHIKETLRPYIDIILFVVALLAANYFWKFTVLGDEDGIQVTWFGMDITRPFDAMSEHISSVVYWLLSLTNDHVYFFEPNLIHFETGTGTRIVWGCTGLKQSFIWITSCLAILSDTPGRTTGHLIPSLFGLAPCGVYQAG